MILVFIIVFLSIIINIVVFFCLNSYYKSLEKKVDGAFLTQSEDFFKKIDFLFNRMNQHKDLIHQQTVDTITPFSKTIELLRQKLDEMEKSRAIRETSLQNNIGNLSKHNDDLIRMTEQLAQQTTKMINAFKTPTVRGQWGEVQLKRLVEICGMVPYCEFSTQQTIGQNRPDMIVTLPNNCTVYVDSKNPMDAYLKYLDDDDLPKFKKDNVKAIKGHITNLSNKAYWKLKEELCTSLDQTINTQEDQYALSPEFVVMFIPLEILWLSALEEDGDILEFAAKRNIIIATPMTLISLLKVINLGWSQLKISRNTEKIKNTLNTVIEAVGLFGKMAEDIHQNQQENAKKIVKLTDMISKINSLVPRDL